MILTGGLQRGTSPSRSFLMFLAVSSVVVLMGLFGQADAYFTPPDPDVYYYTQKLDHFNSTDQRTFTQRYLIYDKYWTNHTSSSKDSLPRPIFFCPGGEAAVTGGYEHNGYMFELGAPLGALLVFPEHRFYGDSLPYGMDSFNSSVVYTLSIEQALQDYLVIIDFVKQKWNVPENTAIVAFGGSYPGELASFLRIANPDVILGSLASSAPVRYHPFINDGTKSGAFYSVVTETFAIPNKACPSLVRSAYQQIDSLIETASGRQTLAQQLNLCNPISADNIDAERRILNLWIMNAFASLAMENYPYPIEGSPAHPLWAACNTLQSSVNNNIPIVQALALAIGVEYNISGEATCNNVIQEYYPCADITGCGGGDDPNSLSWDYQSCTEIIANIDTNGITDMFPAAPYNFTRLIEYCSTKWNVVPQPTLIPQKYNFTQATNVIYSNGLLDPWFPGGVLKNITGQSVTALQMHGAAHHLDLRGSDPNDPKSVRQVRQQEANIILGWLKDHAKSFFW
eukprot:TRINITY_DN6430_c0_g3_i1.p1 TRINITY_DN6430_c0_g3~~TRINITY_DN6430_c0_g3_i1.p1  ORF type:complete len:537 (+),score=216.95 TRINITY_DN6430_c0_g3_i1:76-1611(+)